MSAIKVMIVEDVDIVAEDIASKLRANDMEVTGIYRSGESALAAVTIDQPDVILMDIQLAGAMDGISTAKMISDQYSVPLIYLSDHSDNTTFGRATKTTPFGYLAKPFQEPELIRTIHLALGYFKANERTRNSRDHIFVKGDGNTLVKLLYSEIVYIEADRAYCHVVTNSRKYVLSVSMSNVVEQIDHSDFVRVHRSYVVNVNKITGIDGNVIKLGTQSVEMSKSMREDVLSRLNIL
jgi:DNA-binding LytR/AlgR family response regulator